MTRRLEAGGSETAFEIRRSGAGADVPHDVPGEWMEVFQHRPNRFIGTGGGRSICEAPLNQELVDGTPYQRRPG